MHLSLNCSHNMIFMFQFCTFLFEVCTGLFAAWPIARRLQEELLGYPGMLSCGHNPVKPVKWTFQFSTDSTVTDIKPSERHIIRSTSLVITSVEASDAGLYICTDAVGHLHTIHLTISGEYHANCHFIVTTSYKILLRYKLEDFVK